MNRYLVYSQVTKNDELFNLCADKYATDLNAALEQVKREITYMYGAECNHVVTKVIEYWTGRELALPEPPPKAHVVIIMDGGIVEQIISNVPIEDATVLDRDLEGGDKSLHTINKQTYFVSWAGTAVDRDFIKAVIKEYEGKLPDDLKD